MRLEMLESIEKHNSITVAKYEADFKKLREDLAERDCNHDRKLVEAIEVAVGSISLPLKNEVYANTDKMMVECNT